MAVMYIVGLLDVAKCGRLRGQDRMQRVVSAARIASSRQKTRRVALALPPPAAGVHRQTATDVGVIRADDHATRTGELGAVTDHGDLVLARPEQLP